MWAIKNIIETLSPMLKSALETSDTLVPINAIRPTYREDLFRSAETRSACKGDILFNSGELTELHIYLLNGAVELQYPSGYIETIYATENFLPLAHDFPRPCSAVAISDCTILYIDSAQLDQTLSWSQISDYLISELSSRRDLDNEIDFMHLILQSNLFFKVPPVNAQNIFDKLTSITVKEGDRIIKQGDKGDCCYFLKDGNADIFIQNNSKEGPQKIAEITNGRCFGEDALINKAPRNASVIMSTDGTLMQLNKIDFDTLLEEPEPDELSDADIGHMMEAPIFIDVRTEDEYQLNHLAFSANIPLGLLITKKRLLSPEKPYVFYCDTGRRSRAAAFLMGKEGFNTYALKNGYLGQNLASTLVNDTSYILRDGELELDNCSLSTR